jgi:hypothetical protein
MCDGGRLAAGVLAAVISNSDPGDKKGHTETKID